LQIWSHWKVADHVYQERLNHAMESMRETSRIIREANAYRQDAQDRSNRAWDLNTRGHWIYEDTETGERHEIDNADIDKAYFVPKLCNQCDNPPCVQVCPVGATYQTADGVVLVDRTWCIGCGYCIMGCPYGVRYFHPQFHVAEKCNFCYHRITKGMKTACVDACPFDARQIGNLNDPDDPVTKVIMTERVAVLKEEYGTKPQVYYLGLSYIGGLPK